MKKSLGLFQIIISIIVLLSVACNKAQKTDEGEGEQHIGGTKLDLVAEYKPLRLYFYADTASTNQSPDYAVFKGEMPVFYRENTTSNTVVTTHFENGFATLTTERDENERVLDRKVYMYDDLGTPSAHRYNLKYIYLDNTGNGSFDKFIEFGTNVFTYNVYGQSNLSWVPIRNSNGKQN